MLLYSWIACDRTLGRLFFWQTIFIISVCNNQLLNWIENELIWVLSLIPGFAPALPHLTAKLHAMKEKYMAPAPPASSDMKVPWLTAIATSRWFLYKLTVGCNFFLHSNAFNSQQYLHWLSGLFLIYMPSLFIHPQVKNWDFSFAGMWNTVVWLMLLNFFFKIVNSTAQSYLKKQQEKEIAALTNSASALTHSD